MIAASIVAQSKSKQSKQARGIAGSYYRHFFWSLARSLATGGNLRRAAGTPLLTAAWNNLRFMGLIWIEKGGGQQQWMAMPRRPRRASPPLRRRMNDEVEFASSRVALNWRSTVRRRAITSVACEVQREQLKWLFPFHGPKNFLNYHLAISSIEDRC